MHPELYLVVHRQAERELETRLEHRRVALERGAVAPLTAREAARRGAARAAARVREAATGLAHLMRVPGGTDAGARTRLASIDGRAAAERCLGAACPA